MKKNQCFKLLFLVSMVLMLGITASVYGASESNPPEQQENVTPEKPNDDQSQEVPEEKPDGLTLEKNGRYSFYENGKKVKNQWREVDGKKYFFQKNGYSTPYSLKIKGKVYVFNSKSQLYKPKKKSIYKSKGYYYYVNTDGTANTGWLIIKNKLYKANGKNGRFVVNKTENGIIFGKNGAAVNNTAAKLKMRAMKIVSQITTKKMTKSQKLRACWKYIVHSGKFRYRSTSPNIWKKGWQQEFALSMLTNYSGSCSSFACAFAALAAEVGYTPYVVSGRVPGSRDGAADGMTRHCWVTINGKHYDPEGTWAGWTKCYLYGYSSYPIYHTVRQVINFKTYVK